MSDIQTMKDMLTGLKQKKKNLEANEKIFLRVSGLNEEIEKASQDKAEYEKELVEAKKTRDAAKAKKADAVAKTTFKITKKMNQVLTEGSAVFSYDEDKDGNRSMLIGWAEEKEKNKHDGKPDFKTGFTPYNGLSGMQKQVFDAALANVLDANIIVLEAAELDPDNLQKTLEQLAQSDKQVIVNTCHQLPVDVGLIDEFEIVEV